MKRLVRFILIIAIVYCSAAKEATAAEYDKELKVTAEGYGGPIQMIVGVDKNGVIKNIRILEHHETAGIGSKVSEPEFIKQFYGKTAREVMACKGIDGITGATISSDAVIEAVGKAVNKNLSDHPSQLQEKQEVCK